MLKRLDSSNEMPVVRDGPPCTRVGRKGRRYSGVSDVGQLPKELQKDVEDIMERVGASCWDVTRGLFTLPREVRNALDVPLLRTAKQTLRHYIENRTECEAFLDDRDLAKELFRGLMNTGGEPLIRRVLHKANKTLQDMPKFVLEFQAEQSVLLGKDVANHPELARQLPPGTLQSVLNEEYERKNTDLLAELSSTFGLVNSYEHDGIYCLAMPTPSCRSRALDHGALKRQWRHFGSGSLLCHGMRLTSIGSSSRTRAHTYAFFCCNSWLTLFFLGDFAGEMYGDPQKMFAWAEELPEALGRRRAVPPTGLGLHGEGSVQGSARAGGQDVSHVLRGWMLERPGCSFCQCS